jgi:hypothetical protein
MGRAHSHVFIVQEIDKSAKNEIDHLGYASPRQKRPSGAATLPPMSSTFCLLFLQLISQKCPFFYNFWR